MTARRPPRSTDAPTLPPALPDRYAVDRTDDAQPDRSSLMAIRALGEAALGRPSSPRTHDGGRGGTARLAVALPSSASGVIAIDGDVVASATTPAPVQTLAAPPPAPPSAVPASSVGPDPAHGWILGGLASAVVALAALVVLSAPRTVIVQTPTHAPTSSLASATVSELAKEARSGDVIPHDEPAAATEEAASTATATVASSSTSKSSSKSPSTSTSTSKSKSKSSSKSKSKSSSKASSKASSKSSAKSKATGSRSSGAGMPSVECVLDPSACATEPTGSPNAASRSAADDPLPAKLTTAQIRTALAPVKTAAKQCGRTHGLAAGDAVKVKLSIRGAGSVARTTTLGAHAGGGLAACISTAVGKARFPRFSTPVMGVMYTFRM